MARYTRIVILTGAGISAESGISTFRDRDGIWAKVDVREVATPEGFARNPQRVLDFYNMRRKASGQAKPNEGHLALARLEKEHNGDSNGLPARPRTRRRSSSSVGKSIAYLQHPQSGIPSLALAFRGHHNATQVIDFSFHQPHGSDR